jgi:hypothetical protein
MDNIYYSLLMILIIFISITYLFSLLLSLYICVLHLIYLNRYIKKHAYVKWNVSDLDFKITKNRYKIKRKIEMEKYERNWIEWDQILFLFIKLFK